MKDLKTTLGSLLALALVLACAAPALAADASIRGQLDCSVFSDYADEEGEWIEVHIPGNLLEAIFAKQQIEGIAYIKVADALSVTLREDQKSAALEKVRQLERRLRREGWEPVVKVREGKESVTVLIDSEESDVYGLLVLVVDRGQPSLACVNIAGKFDLSSLMSIIEGMDVDVPGLEQIEEAQSK